MNTKKWTKGLRILGFTVLLAFSPEAQSQLLGRLPVHLILKDSGGQDYTFADTGGDRTLDLGKHMIKLTGLTEAYFKFEFHEPIYLKLQSKTSGKPLVKVLRELDLEFTALDFMALNQVFNSRANVVVSFDIFDEMAEDYIEWYLGKKTSPPPHSRPKLFKIYGLHLTMNLQSLFRAGFILPAETDAIYHEVLDPKGNTAPESIIKPLAFWEMRSMLDPLVHQILIIASSEREIDLPPTLPQEGDRRGRLLEFRRKCSGPFGSDKP